VGENCAQYRFQIWGIEANGCGFGWLGDVAVQSDRTELKRVAFILVHFISAAVNTR